MTSNLPSLVSDDGSIEPEYNKYQSVADLQEEIGSPYKKKEDVFRSEDSSEDEGKGEFHF